METVRLVPVLTSDLDLRSTRFIDDVAGGAPTESRASTGTPAANMVDRVRVQRAMVALRMTSPMTGICRIIRSTVACMASSACRK